MQVGAAAQGLSQVVPGALGHVVDEDDGSVVAPVELAQEAEQAGDVSGAVFVEPVQSHERVEQ